MASTTTSRSSTSSMPGASRRSWRRRRRRRPDPLPVARAREDWPVRDRSADPAGADPSRAALTRLLGGGEPRACLVERRVRHRDARRGRGEVPDRGDAGHRRGLDPAAVPGNGGRPVLRQQLGRAVLGPVRPPEVDAPASLGGDAGEEGGVEEEASLRRVWPGGGGLALRPAGQRYRPAAAPGFPRPERAPEAEEAGPAVRVARGGARGPGQGAPGERPEPGGIRDRRAADLAARLPGVSAPWPS